MNDIEIIKEIIKSSNKVEFKELFNNGNDYNLAILCAINNKYLTNENISYLSNCGSCSGSFHGISYSLPISALIDEIPSVMDDISEEVKEDIKEDDLFYLMKRNYSIGDYYDDLDNYFGSYEYAHFDHGYSIDDPIEFTLKNYPEYVDREDFDRKFFFNF